MLAVAFALGFPETTLLRIVNIPAPLPPQLAAPCPIDYSGSREGRSHTRAPLSPDPMPPTLGQRLAELAARSAATDAAAAAALADLQRDGAALAAAMAAAADAAAA